MGKGSDMSDWPPVLAAAYEAEGPVPIEVLKEALWDLVVAHFPSRVFKSEGQNEEFFDALLRWFWEDLEEKEEREPTHRRTGKGGDLSEPEMALIVSRLFFLGAVKREELGEDYDFENPGKRRAAAFDLPFLAKESAPRRMKRGGYNPAWRAYKRQLERFFGELERTYGSSETDQVEGEESPDAKLSDEGEQSIEKKRLTAVAVPLQEAIRVLFAEKVELWSRRLSFPKYKNTYIAGCLALLLGFLIFWVPRLVQLNIAQLPEQSVDLTQEADLVQYVEDAADNDYWEAGWGPEREPYSVESDGSPYPAFNGISDNPNIGDERSFVAIRPDTDVDAEGIWSSEVWADVGDSFTVRMFVHNSGQDEVEPLQDATLRAGFSKKTDEMSISAVLSATNADTVWDGITIHLGKDTSVKVHTGVYMENSAYPTGGTHLSSSDLFSDGVLLGGEKLDGIIKSGYQYASFVTFKISIGEKVEKETAIRSVEDDEIFRPGMKRRSPHCKEIEPARGAESLTVWVAQGKDCFTNRGLIDPDRPFEVMFRYESPPEDQVDNVTLRLELPRELEVVDDSTYVATSLSPNGVLVRSELTGSGINLGSYTRGGAVWVITSVRFIGSPLTCELVGQDLQAIAVSDTARSGKTDPPEASAAIKCDG